MKSKSVIIVFLAAMVSVISACSTTVLNSAEDRVNMNSAIIKGLPGWNPLSVIAIQIYRIDDKKFKKPSSHYEVTAGKHQIEVRCSRETPEPIQRYYVFDMKLISGHVYKPKLDMTKDCYVHYVDTTSGKKFIGVED